MPLQIDGKRERAAKIAYVRVCVCALVFVCVFVCVCVCVFVYFYKRVYMYTCRMHV